MNRLIAIAVLVGGGWWPPLASGCVHPEGMGHAAARTAETPHQAHDVGGDAIHRSAGAHGHGAVDDAGAPGPGDSETDTGCASLMACGAGMAVGPGPTVGRPAAVCALSSSYEPRVLSDAPRTQDPPPPRPSV